MKIFVILSLFCVSYAQLQFDVPPMASTRLGDDGTSSITEHYRNDNQGNYDFGYNEGHNQGGTFRRERGDAYGRRYGTYGYTNNEGLIRIVNYVADENGFRAELKSTEPGVDEKEPASVIVFKEDTPTLMTYPGPEAASVPDANGNIPGFPAVAASAPGQYSTAAASQTSQYTAAASAPGQYPASAASQTSQYTAAASAPGQYSTAAASQTSQYTAAASALGQYSTAAASQTSQYTAAASAPGQYPASAASQTSQYSAAASAPGQYSAPSPMPYAMPVATGGQSANVMVNGQYGGYSFSI